MKGYEDLLTIEPEYKRIIANEDRLINAQWHPYKPLDIYNAAIRVLETGKQSLVLRGYHGIYGLTMRNQSIAYESVGGHVNLMSEIVDQFLAHGFGQNVDNKRQPFGHSYRAIMNAVRRHDLPENEIGDIPDNGSGNPSVKRYREQLYYASYALLSSDYLVESDLETYELLQQMEEKKTCVGKMLYTADKVSATIATLCYDLHGSEPRMRLDEPVASERDKKEMAACDDKRHGSCRASEMWTVDYLRERSITQYDEYGFFTALLIMATLLVHKKWYDWREKDYADYEASMNTTSP